MNIIDIHTHHIPQSVGTAIINCYPADFVPVLGQWYSVGIHPMFLQEQAAQLDLLRKRAAHPQVLAIGEAGLDKNADTPMSQQLTLFREQALLTEAVQKPLIIHLVRATDELLAMRKVLSPTQAWIIHGFRGKPALAAEYVRHGMYISFGEKYQEEALKSVPLNRLFMETDESLCSITELYVHAARLYDVPVNTFLRIIKDNIARVFLM